MVEFASLHSKKKQKPSSVLFLFNVKRHRSQAELHQHDDPFAAAMLPPPNEDEATRNARLRSMEEAERKSKEIDDDIAETKKKLDKNRKTVKLLLLGQAESGKSTTLKNFQLDYSPKQFLAERLAWRVIIQLNLIRCVKHILEILEDEWERPSSFDSLHSETDRGKGRQTQSLLTNEHKKICLRLRPLLEVEITLTREIDLEAQPLTPSFSGAPRELCVRADSGWRRALTMRKSKSMDKFTDQQKANETDTTGVLAACRDDIMELWADPIVRKILHRRKVKIELMPGFFLDDTERIAQFDYEPTDDDILRARLRTLGVQEYRFKWSMPSGSIDWSIYDVGGVRNARHKWAPFFDDVNVIIFLAPLVFHQSLEEDPTVNRLQDSIALWKDICSNELLKNTNIILFLNKMDILEANLKSGILLKTYVPAYGDRPNDIEHVSEYFRKKFYAYHKKLSPPSRVFYCYETSVTHRKSTSALLAGVRDAIIQERLRKLDVL